MRFLLMACFAGICCMGEAGTIRIKFEAEFEDYSRSSRTPEIPLGIFQQPISGLYAVDDLSSRDFSKDGGSRMTRYWNLLDFQLNADWLAHGMQLDSGTVSASGSSPSEPVDRARFLYNYLVSPQLTNFSLVGAENYNIIDNDDELEWFLAEDNWGADVGHDCYYDCSERLLRISFLGPANITSEFGFNALPPSSGQFFQSNFEVVVGFVDGGEWKVSYRVTHLSIVPEPSTAMLLMAAPALLVSRRRRHA